MMWQAVLKVVISAALIVAAAEVGKRSAILGAVLISLPLSSVLALSFLYFDTGDPQKVMDLSKGILLMLLPSFTFFFALIGLLAAKQSYWVALPVSCLAMALVFAGYVRLLGTFGWKIF